MESIINPDYYLLGVFVALAIALVAAIVRGERTMKSAREREKKAQAAEISYQNALADLKCSTKHLWATYKFSESDFIKFGSDHRAMEREARQRMACALGRRIVKELGATELIENGVLIGYKIEVDVRKQTKGFTIALRGIERMQRQLNGFKSDARELANAAQTE